MTVKSPSIVFRDSLAEVNNLLAIHTFLTGENAGRRGSRVQVLNKSAILFMCASFEAFVEDLSNRAFAHLLENIPDHSHLPKNVLQEITKKLKEHKHDLKIWELAGDGWKIVLREHRDELVARYVGYFNTPNPQKIDELLYRLIGYQDISKCWHWKGMKAETAAINLEEFVDLRHRLAHGVALNKAIQKKDVKGYLSFLAPLSVKTSNSIRIHCHTITGSYPWPQVQFGTVE